jgi:hypothetical protein
MSNEKATVRVQRFENLKFVPRFETGEMAWVSTVCGTEDGTELNTGRSRLPVSNAGFFSYSLGVSLNNTNCQPSLTASRIPNEHKYHAPLIL